MSHFYLDASAVVKRYSPETGSTWIKALTSPTAGHTIILGGNHARGGGGCTRR